MLTNTMLAELLWVAPELVRETSVPGRPATQKGDVYSFSIILEEIVVRGGPYEMARQTLSVQGTIHVFEVHTFHNFLLGVLF